MENLKTLWEDLKSIIFGIWTNHKRVLLISSIILGFLLVAFSTAIVSLSFATGTTLMFCGIFWFAIENSKKNFWGSTAFLLIVMGIFIGWLMVVSTISPDKIQGLLTVYITIDTAIIAVVFAATAIKPEHFLPIKKTVRDFLLITSFWILFSILIYCLSFFDLFNSSLGFKIILGGSTLLQIFIIFIFMRIIDEMFDRVVQPTTSPGPTNSSPSSSTPVFVPPPCLVHATPSPERENLIDHIEEQMNKTSQSYFETTVNLIKWNTALAIAAILWIGNNIVNVQIPLQGIPLVTAFLSMMCLSVTIAISIAIFYLVSRYFNNYWVLCSEWRENVLSYNPQNRVVDRLTEHYKSLPKTAKTFDFYVYLQIMLLALGMGLFTGFILSVRYAHA